MLTASEDKNEFVQAMKLGCSGNQECPSGLPTCLERARWMPDLFPAMWAAVAVNQGLP